MHASIRRVAFAKLARRESVTLYHLVDACKIGVDEALVVEPCWRVCADLGPRVEGASIMPFLTMGNANAPTIMIGGLQQT